MLTKSKIVRLAERGRDVELWVAAVGDRGGAAADSAVVRKSIIPID